MPLLEIPKTNTKLKASIELEQSTVDSLDRYAAFSAATGEQVIEQALQYVFRKDKDFAQYLEQHKGKAVEPSLKIAAKPGRKASESQS
jgi:hypothetical protein